LPSKISYLRKGKRKTEGIPSTFIPIGRGEIRRNQLLDDIKERRNYWKWTEEA
jgi:hypothetical protein